MEAAVINEFDRKKLCPAAFSFQVVGGKWNLPLLAVLAEHEPIRHNELKRKLGGITATTLANSLKELIAYGVVHREAYMEMPLRVEYSLTEAGRELVPLIEAIVTWGGKHMPES
ncbi:helix-turn-helix domain-containing protein [Saccharibacillus sp. CPCC 101409]|uniref:winged helix-turn-helix transcriptional regulator n=1 Tax=Saccharibacillus sp. CPCC 101409 TaxID=3058041 RepID=UPI002673755F|nr:helix-turn-helix domain-containing protein [Saccharibacillus sp. CPCC 101409]MDO3409982.1 helix-turn-helix domain-containing protein [Saccharibacillus sp. CPCC 101409]